MAHLVRMAPDRALVLDIANDMAGSSMAEIRVRVNKECPGVDRGTKRWMLLEFERERASISGAVHSQAQAVDTPGAGEGAK